MAAEVVGVFLMESLRVCKPAARFRVCKCENLWYIMGALAVNGWEENCTACVLLVGTDVPRGSNLAIGPSRKKDWSVSYHGDRL